MKDGPLMLSTLADGAVELRFQEELEKLLANVDDPNTDAEKRRDLVVKLSFAPSKSRREIEVSIEVSSKLAPHAPVETTTWLAFDSAAGRYVIQEHNPKQARLDFEREKEARSDNPADVEEN